MTFKPGENVGPYRILDQLGQGGMATVFKAYHANLDRYVAIKVLHAAFKEDPNFEKRFQREAKVVANLEHPNIVPVYDFSEHEGSPYLVMRFIEGETLKARLTRGAMPPDEAIAMIDKVGDGLAYAHEKGVLHRDIKPSNIMLTNEGQVFLADFGLARIAQAGESTLSQDMMLGTPAYISPEQARGERNLDARTDIYSLGVILYEMVVGQVPFSADTPFAVIHDHIYSPLPTPRSLNPSVPESVERVLLKALAKDRDDRFENARQLTDAFHNAVQEAGQDAFASAAQTMPLDAVTAEIEGSTPHPDQTKRMAVTEADKPKRRWWVWGLVGIGGLAGLCLAFLAIGSALGLFEEEEPVETETVAEEMGDEAVIEPEPIEGFEGIFTDEIREGPPPPEGHCAEERISLMPVELAEARANEFPDNACAHLELAVAFSQAGMDEPAEAHLEDAVNLGLSGETLVLLGEVMFREDDFPGAAHFFTMAYAERGVLHAEPMAFWAIMESFGSPEAGDVQFELNEMYPQLAIPKSADAVNLAFQGDFDLAEQRAIEGIVAQPESPVAHYAMGLVFLESGRVPAARLQFACVLRSLDTPPNLREEVEHLLEDIGPLELDQPLSRPDDAPVELLGCALDRLRD